MTDSKTCIVCAHNAKGHTLYYATDSSSGGYPYWTSSMRSADWLTREQADQVITDMQRPNDERGFPNSNLQQAAELDFNTPSGGVVVQIGEMIFQPIPGAEVEIMAKITKDEVEAKRKALIEQAKGKLSLEERKALGLA